MTTPVLKGLPTDFRSFYRLFRRACSASVLHRNAQSVALRNLYRTTFRRAGLIYMHAQNKSAKDGEKTEKKKAWLDIWNKRMDNTLSLLYNSSHTRGLPHQITKFLGHFIYVQRRRHYESKNKGLTWNGQLPPNSPQYQPPQPTKPGKIAKQERKQLLSTFEQEALGPLREVVRMAEGRDEISFGNLKNYTRVRPRKTPPRYDKFFQ
ncbi:hypothetical protein D9756_005562 [Leucocoprinus leucothites]|uniref:Uncharacterized protein n=1 Tax=Leucocoprinus leucothites TaxID=201217 RepID=A0A8H5D7W9_9AGAR|nr:hypothetical protein D9756_005562 [Leucoagaricus leucothites]